jgi:hypothetical protein
MGFILLRHVNTPKSDWFWQESYYAIRKYYPDHKIVIIDNQSNPLFLSDIPMTNTEIVNSPYDQRGEFAPFYYFLKEKWFETAVIVHDTAYLQRPIPWETEKYRFFWGFHFKDHKVQRRKEALEMIDSLDNADQVRAFYDQPEEWCGALGSMMSVRHEFLVALEEKYHWTRWIDVIVNKNYREAMERVLPCLMQNESRPPRFVVAIDMFSHLPYGLPFDDRHKHRHLDVIKVWGSRK